MATLEMSKTKRASGMYAKIESLLGDQAELLSFDSPKISKERLILPGGDFIDRVHSASGRPGGLDVRPGLSGPLNPPPTSA